MFHKHSFLAPNPFWSVHCRETGHVTWWQKVLMNRKVLIISVFAKCKSNLFKFGITIQFKGPLQSTPFCISFVYRNMYIFLFCTWPKIYTQRLCSFWEEKLVSSLLYFSIIFLQIFCSVIHQTHPLSPASFRSAVYSAQFFLHNTADHFSATLIL